MSETTKSPTAAPTDKFDRDGLASARSFAKEFGITDKAEIAAMAAQFAYDLRKHDEMRTLASEAAA